jgi:protein ImuB
MTMICVLAPRFELLAALPHRRELLRKPLALGPEPGGSAVVGEVSGAAEALGIHPGMRVAEALARCPRLGLVPPDPAGAGAAWDRILRRLEAIGAAVESDRSGEAFFRAGGMLGLAGGHLDDVLARARRAVGIPVRIGAGPSRLSAYAAARRGGRRRPVIVPAGAARTFLASQPVSLLCGRLDPDEEGSALVSDLERLGVRTLGELAALSRPAIADRFGRLGLRARALARGADPVFRPRPAPLDLRQELELPEPAFGPRLERALAMLIDRLLARPERRRRTLRSVRLSARLVEGGGWQRGAVLRQATASATQLRLVLAPRLSELPAPVELLALEATALGPAGSEQMTLLQHACDERLERLGEAVRQARAAAGDEAVLRILEVEPSSPVPERRMALSSWS